jgi:cytochrome c oxidase cbb3-type subunit 3
MRTGLVRGLGLWVSAVILVGLTASAQTPAPKKVEGAPPPPSADAKRGETLFGRDCAFCHGRDAGGGETGPDLTRSRLVRRDGTGERVRAVVQGGRPDKGMPPFPRLTAANIADLVAFIRYQITVLDATPGQRRGVEASDLQTGNAEAGKAYFNGPGRCASCHSPTGDLAGIADRYIGLELEKKMLYPENAKSKVTVTTASGQVFSGTLAYKDEFTIGVMDAGGWYKSWPTNDVQYNIDSPAAAHAEQLEKYSDDDIHNLMAYLQTLR